MWERRYSGDIYVICIFQKSTGGFAHRKTYWCMGDTVNLYQTDISLALEAPILLHDIFFPGA